MSVTTYERARHVVNEARNESLPEPVRKIAREQLDALNAGTVKPYRADQNIRDAKVGHGVPLHHGPAKKATQPAPQAEPMPELQKKEPKRKGPCGRIHSSKRTTEVLTNTLGTLDSIQIAIDPIEDLSTLTDEEAARIRGGFQKAVRSLNRIINLTKGNQS
jgi:hypothetical protein